MTASDWIALAAVGATAVTAVAAFTASHLQMKQTRRIAVDDRLFAARSEAYEHALRLINHRWSMAEHYLSAARKGEENAAAPPEPFSPDEMDALRAKMDLFASERVRAPFDQFWGALGAYAFRFGQLQADEEAKEAGLPIPESEIEDVRNMVREAARQVTDSLAEVKQRMSEGLTDA